MPKQLSDERQAAELAKLLREIARDLGAGILATDLPAPFKKARDLCTMLDHGWTPTSGVYDADHPAVRFFKKRYGVNVTGHSFSGASINPCPPNVQTARVRAVRALLWRLQERAMCGQKAEADDLAKLLTLADSLQPTAKAPDGAGKEEAADDGNPFYKPKYFAQRWDIDDELLRRKAIPGKKYTEGKVRRTKKKPASGKGKRAVYWYSEPDARRCWPDRFAIAEDERTRKESKPPTL